MAVTGELGSRTTTTTTRLLTAMVCRSRDRNDRYNDRDRYDDRGRSGGDRSVVVVVVVLVVEVHACDCNPHYRDGTLCVLLLLQQQVPWWRWWWTIPFSFSSSPS